MELEPEVEPATVRLWALCEDALLEEHPDGSLTMVTRWGEVTVRAVEGLGTALRRMALGPVSLRNVAGRAAGAQADRSADADVVRLERALGQFSGSIVHSLGLPDGQPPLLSATPIAARSEFRLAPMPHERLVRLSRFAVLRPLDDLLVLESPGASFRVTLCQTPAVRIATALAAPTGIQKLAKVAEVGAAVVADVVAFLVAAGVALVADEEDRFRADQEPELRHWTHHELLFAAFSRSFQMEVGGGLAEGTPGGIVKPVPSGPRLPLHRPDLTVRDDRLGDLLESDHHCPEFTSADLTAEMIGELLFRSARIRSIGTAHVPIGAGEASQRPYFNIACLYELELYLTVNRCLGLPRGIYHYDPLAHALTLVEDDAGVVATLLDLAMAAAANRCRPAGLITITSRMNRIAPLLTGSAYATTLTHVGALQQTLYLVGKAMGLSAHAVVIDGGDVVDHALGLDWPGEIAVGESVLDRLA
ncbi:SagB family peptide dehydrogenase [Actinomycetes bacterium KLBMP 9797]